jgi:hypothetical protein
MPRKSYSSKPWTPSTGADRVDLVIQPRLLALVTSTIALLAAPSARADDLLYAATVGPPPHLVGFYADTPGTLLSDVPVTGLGSADVITGLDARPTDGKLYVLTRDSGGVGRVWTVDPVTGAATQVSRMTADPTDATIPYTGLPAGGMGVDFDPVSDRLRVITETSLNMRVNVQTGGVISDGNLAPAGQYAGVAYFLNDNDPATNTTTEYAYRWDNDAGGTVNPPNDGTFIFVGHSGGSAVPSGDDDLVALDVSRAGVMYAMHQTAANTMQIYTVSPVAGTHTLRGTIGLSANANGLTAAVPNVVTVQTDATTVAESAGVAKVTVVRTNPSGTTTFAYATVDGTSMAGSDYTATSGSLTFTGVETVKTIDVPIVDDADDEGVETFNLTASVAPGPDGVASTPNTTAVSIADDDPAVLPPVVIQLPPDSPPVNPSDTAACDKAKAKLAKAKAKLKRLMQHDAPKSAIDKAKAKIKKQRGSVKAACG